MLAINYSISVAQVSREIKHLLPMILAALDELPHTLPNNLVESNFENVIELLTVRATCDGVSTHVRVIDTEAISTRSLLQVSNAKKLS